MRWFIDTEFHEDGRIIDLISIALVSEAGTPYYAISSDFDPNICSDWVKQNVLPSLESGREFWKPRTQIAEDIRELTLYGSPNGPEFWGYFCDYDWVVLCQLYGRMIDLPRGFPMFCLDLKQKMHELGISKSDLPQQDVLTLHNALDDAHWIRSAWIRVGELEKKWRMG